MSLVSKFGELDIYLASDHSQLEVRVLAQMSKDERLIELIKTGEDIHCSVGAELTGLPVEKIKKDRDTRTAIKGIHFGIIYGLQKKNLYFKLQNDAAGQGREFKMSKQQVESTYDNYFKKFKKVKEFIENQHLFAQENAFVDTLFGFRREIAIAGDETRTTFWANQAVNSPIQGTAHQLLLIAMAILKIRQQTYHLLQRPSMEVHDALYVFTPLRNLAATYKQSMQLLEEEVLVYVKKWWPEVDWVVPLKAEAKAGFRLGVMVEYEGGPEEEFVEKWCQKNREFEIKFTKEMKDSLTA